MLHIITNHNNESDYSDQEQDHDDTDYQEFSWDDVDVEDIPYIMGKEIGRGVTSIVYEAHHALHGVCAVKVSHLDQNEFMQDEVSFLRKVQGHPNMIKVLDVWEKDGMWHIAMEKLVGTLDDMMREVGSSFLPNEVCQFARQMASALHYLYEKKIVHFDLKPHNIGYVYGKRGVPIYKLFDFGISETFDTIHSKTFQDELCSGECVKVSLLYRPVEWLCHAEKINEKTDIWSLGCILYEMTCGHYLFCDLSMTHSIEYNEGVYARGIEKAATLLQNKDAMIHVLGQIIRECLKDVDTRISATLLNRIFKSLA